MMDDLILDHSRQDGAWFVRRWLEREPHVAQRMREVGACFVIVEPAEGPLFERTREAIAAAQVAGKHALFVALTYMPAIVATGAFAVRHRGAPMIRMPGEFLGYIAIGEGGVAFFDETGAMSTPPAEFVLARL